MRDIDVSAELLPQHHDVMRCLGLFSQVMGTDGWCLVGGMMVLVVAREAGRTDSRAEQTKDGDVLIDVVTHRGALARAGRELNKLGYTHPADDDRGAGFARCTFVSGHAQVDLLAPEDATDEQLDVGGNIRSIAIPGGRRALQGSAMTRLYYDEESTDVELRVPAELIEDYAGADDGLNDAYITLCVHAEIAAADVICCAKPGGHYWAHSGRGPTKSGSPPMRVASSWRMSSTGVSQRYRKYSSRLMR